MSQSEFDQYLALLGGFLRLNASQREAIANELRDHLEERLAALLAQGIPRQKAIETALEEFGDATGLASEFVQIFRKQRRRWMMRMTLGTTAGLAAMVLLTLAFWPPGRPGPAPAQVVAQEEAASPTKKTPLAAPIPGTADSRADAELRQRVDFNFFEKSLTLVLQTLCDQVDLQFHLKTRALEEIGISDDVPVSLALKHVPLEMGLDLMLEPLELTYIVRDRVIVVTTEEDLDSVAEVRVYNCRDLLALKPPSGEMKDGPEMAPVLPGGPGDLPGVLPGGIPKILPGAAKQPAKQSNLPVVPRHVLAQFGGGQGGFGGGGGGGMESYGMDSPSRPLSRARQLMDIIMTAIVPNSWEQMGGAGTIAEFDGLIVIRHNPRIHRQVDQVLEMLREASAKQPWNDPEVGVAGGGGFF